MISCPESNVPPLLNTFLNGAVTLTAKKPGCRKALIAKFEEIFSYLKLQLTLRRASFNPHMPASNRA